MYGIGLRTAHYGDWLGGATPAIDFVEAITENFATRQGRPWAVLEVVRRHVPIVFHGVSLSLGGADPIDREYVRSIRSLASRFDPLWISDHLCFGSSGGHHAHDLWPLPRTESMVDHAAARIAEVQDLLGRRLLVENISTYVQYASDEMSEADFVAEVVRRADCDLLLDVNNIVVNAFNHGFDPHAFVRAMPADRVKQLHVAGHARYATHLFDDHRGPVPESTWAVFDTAVKCFGEVPTLIEWDKDVPPLVDVVAEALLARVRGREKSPRRPPNARSDSSFAMRSNPFEAMAQLWHVVRHDARDDALGAFRSSGLLEVRQAIAVYKNAYWIRQHEVLRDLFPLLEEVLGSSSFRELVRRYLRAYPSSHPELEHLGAHLPEFLRAQRDLELSDLASVAALEQARVDSALAADSTVALSTDIEPASFARSRLRVIASLRMIPLDDHALRILGRRDFEVVGASHAVVSRPRFAVTTHLIGRDEQSALAQVLAGATVEQLLESYDHDFAALHRPIERWFRRGWIHAIEVI